MTGLWILAGLGLAVGVVFAPRWGLRALLRQWLTLRRRIVSEDVLKYLEDCKQEGLRATRDSLAGVLKLPRRRLLSTLERMETAGLLQSHGGGELRLTPEGERWALRVIRAHRLWERYLADEARMPMNQIHRAAHRAEHLLTDEQIEALDAHLGHPLHDPHGDPIPTASGEMEPLEGMPLTDWPLDKPARILHIEDEPEIVFKQILALGLKPDGRIRVLESTPERLVLSDGEEEHRLAPVIASNIRVAETAGEMQPPAPRRTLADLAFDEEAWVARLDAACQGFTRRRLLDLGMTPGTRVRAELQSAFGGPRAYRVRGTLIALRREQAGKVEIEDSPPPQSSTPESSIPESAEVVAQ